MEKFLASPDRLQAESPGPRTPAGLAARAAGCWEPRGRRLLSSASLAGNPEVGFLACSRASESNHQSFHFLSLGLFGLEGNSENKLKAVKYRLQGETKNS